MPLASPIVLLDPFGNNPTSFVENEDRRVGDTGWLSRVWIPKAAWCAREVAIQQAELRDHATAFVGQKRETDALGGRKLVQCTHSVVADADQPDAPSLKLTLDLLQFNELRFAIWSPSRASVEDDDCTPAIAPALQTDGPPLGIRKLEVRKLVAEGGADLAVVQLGHEATSRKSAMSSKYRQIREVDWPQTVWNRLGPLPVPTNTSYVWPCRGEVRPFEFVAGSVLMG